MKEKICQSCSFPLTEIQMFGTNQDGSSNDDYCLYCYKDGKFIDDVSMDEYIEMNVQYYEQAGMQSESEMRDYCNKVFPTLKRWLCTCSDECASGYNPNCTCTSSECHCKDKN